MLQARLGGQKCAVQVDRQHLLPLGEGELVQRVDNLDPGVADENVDIAVGCDGGQKIRRHIKGARTDHGRHWGKPWGREKRRSGVGQPLCPARPHAVAAELVVFRVPLRVGWPVDELDDIHRGRTTKIIKKFRFRRIAEVFG